MSDRPSYEVVLGDIGEHQMTVVRDEGAHRHLKFRNPDQFACWFDIVTWPGTFCIRGDCGTYVFSRVEDMFTFFRGTPGRIDLDYWAEKINAADRAGVKQWSADRFRAAVVDDFKQHTFRTLRDRLECFREVRESVLDAEDAYEAAEGVRNFDSYGFCFQDFWEHDLREFTYRFVWNCHAIVWAIDHYDRKIAAAKGAAA